MTDGKQNIHLICNAHIDPVWLWEWQEGAAEVISTFRTAAELCEENETFIFNHNEVTLYKWVAEYEPALFKRIGKLVKAGRWHIMGGWYLQPDCNMPSGESFVRQILLGRNYFKKHFNVEPKTAINFDPFGHTRGLVQIMAKTGYDSYLFGRPDQNDCPLPADEFVWVGYDGSEIMAHRFEMPYNSRLGKAREKVEKYIVDHPEGDLLTVLWGVGNHGGGPSKFDLKRINKLIAQTKDRNILHSTPEAYFKQLSRIKHKLPKYKKDLNPWAVGCYTSQIRIKQKQRQLENEIYSTEKMVSAAVVQGLMRYPQQDFKEALHDLMVGQFHDILPGSSIQPVEEAALRMLDHGLEIMSRVKARTFFALSSGQPKAKEGIIPILVYNPHPYKVKQLIECEFQLPDIAEPDVFNRIDVYHKGRIIPSQVEQEISNLAAEWRKRVAFIAEIEPNQITRFDCKPQLVKKKPRPKLRQHNGKITFRTSDIEVIINTKTGFVDRYRIKGVDYTGKNAFEPIVIKDNEDSWGMTCRSFRDLEGRFKLMSKKAGTKFSGVQQKLLDSVRVIEDGDARSVIEAVFSYGDSFICQRYKLPKTGTEIEVETRVYWNEKDKMLKLSVPIANKECEYLGQVAYGVGELPVNGDEAVAQKWVAAISRKSNTALTCINDGTYGSSFSQDGLRLTLLRSPAYSCHPHQDKLMLIADRCMPRIDQGERIFRFWFNAGRIRERLNRIDREALVKNEEVFVLSFFPSGDGKKPQPLAVLSDDVVQITTIKKAQNNNDLIVRLFEPTGFKRSTVLSLPALRKRIKVNMTAFEIKTFRINPKTGKHIEVNLLERPLQKL